MKKTKLLLKTLFYMVIFISLALNLLAIAMVVYDIDVRANFESFMRERNRIHGRRSKVDPISAEQKLIDEQRELIKNLESIGYVSGSTPAPELKNITVYDKERIYEGLNLYTSGHAPEAILMDAEGNELHKWSYDFWKIWPDYELPEKNIANHDFWRRVYLYENGDLLAIFEGIGLIKLDKDSNLLWARQCNSHHDLFVDEKNRIYVLTREMVVNEKYNKNGPILEDFISILSPEGNQIKRVSILKSLEDSKYALVLNQIKRKIDLLHTNTIEILDGRLESLSPAFRKGNVLISIRWLRTICVVDMETESVTWALTGLMWDQQHQPTILENGNMLLFDNRGHNGKSKVIEFNPFSQEVFWTYAGTPDTPLYSKSCGASERLPNGNTLISESDAGRAIEVTPNNEIVWEFLNPYRAGENNELIATLFEVIRLRTDFPLDWLDKKPE